MKFASLCVLSYKRPERLKECLTSLINNTNYPYELIVNLDGSDDPENLNFVHNLYLQAKVSKYIVSNGGNRGVGKSFANCVGVSDGDYICKIDADLTFHDPKWLEEGVKIIDRGLVGAVSFFNYRHYDPNDTRFEIISASENYCVVNDFVSSIYLFNRKDLIQGGYNQDDGFHLRLRPLAITFEDRVNNHGFGVTKSVYVSGTEDHPVKTKTFDIPLIFNNEK